MQKVTTLLIGGTVITMNKAFTVIPNGAVAVDGDKIVGIGPVDELLTRFESDDVVDCRGKYILPGLVNAHTHTSMTLMRGMSDDSRLDVWLYGYIMPTEREFVSPEFCYIGTQLACAEMIRGGVTTFTDMYYFESDVARAAVDAGMRAVLGESILKFPTPDAESYENSIAYTRKFIEQWRDHPLITPAIAPHAPYSNTQETLERCTEVALEYDVPLIIHIAESRQEVEDHLKEYEQSVVHWLNKIGLFRAKVIAAHCVWLDETEMRIFREKGASVAHCPTANLKLSSGVAAVQQLLESGVTVGIGTDGPASNNDLDMFEEMRLAAILAKTRTYDPTAVPARTALLMATRHGAKAVHLDKVTGSLETGKLADLIVLDADPLHNWPHYNIHADAVYSQVVYASKAGDVRHTMCHGRWLMRDRQLQTIDEQTLRDQSQAYANRIGEAFSVHQSDILRKLVAISAGMERSESFEVQVKATLKDPSQVEQLFDHPDVEILRATHYRQHDTYFLFSDASKGRVRYREDDRLNDSGDIVEVRARLTYTSPEKEREFESAVLLSHSRFIAPATRPLRFYQEYFKADKQEELIKERRRWRIHYQGVLFFVNVDRLIKPASDTYFIEIKSRTWSLTDAEIKAGRIREMLGIVGVDEQDIIPAEYIEMSDAPKASQ